jgi:hypothetical protein
MNSEIYRPVGMLTVTTRPCGLVEKRPVFHLSVGKITFALEEATFQDGLAVTGVEVHGRVFEINSTVQKYGESRGFISWNTYSFDFTLFQAWVSGLDVNQKEELINDLIDWHSDLEEIAFSESDQFKRSA